MQSYRYQALDSAGHQVDGVREADSARQLRLWLREQGLAPLEVQEIHATAGQQHSRTKIGLAEQALLMRQMATLVKAGLPVERALEVAAQQSSAKVQGVFSRLRAGILEGQSLAQSMRRFPRAFPALITASVAAGEAAGELDIVLLRLADYLEQRENTRKEVWLALLYPLFILLVALLVVWLLLGHVVPKIVVVFDSNGQALPWLTRALLGISDWVQQYGLGLLLIIGLAVTAVVVALRQTSVRAALHKLLLKIPLVGNLLRAGEVARVTATLGLLTQSSVPAVEALDVAADVANLLPVRDAIQTAAVQVREGQSLTQALAQSGEIPDLVLQLVASGEQAGDLPQMLAHAATTQERRLQMQSKTLLGLLQPSLILFVGILVLLIVLAIMLPILNLNSLGNLRTGL